MSTDREHGPYSLVVSIEQTENFCQVTYTQQANIAN